MALKACSRLAGSIPRLLLNRNMVPIACASGRALSNTFGTHSRCAYVRANYKKCVFRSFSSSPSSEIDVSYEQLKKKLVDRAGVVIDVREPWELREYGNIPGSMNVPLGQVNAALQLDPEEFKEMYGGDMPQTTDNIVFSCLAGIRSKKALDTAASLAYNIILAGGKIGLSRNN